MIGSYGSSLNRPHTEEELLKARQALTLLKAHRARGETAAQMIGACIVNGVKGLKKATSTTYNTQFGDAQKNGNYRKVFSQMQSDDLEEQKTGPKAVKTRLDKVNKKFNKDSQDHKPMSNLAILGKNTLNFIIESDQNEFNATPPITNPIKRNMLPTKPPIYNASSPVEKEFNDSPKEDQYPTKPSNISEYSELPD